jgi:transcriptional regulator with PAS, ATPase and Fis domain
LIEGETGTGKELVAQAIHRESLRKDGPFVPINCASIPGGLLESELFGHARGAFTGAQEKKQGLFVAADGGTLFLDEIGEMPPELQAKLLRAIQERRVRPVGSTSDVTFDVRIVSATNRDLRTAASEGDFREDIFYRLATFQIQLPPLRQRREDIPLLVEAFLAQHAAQGRDIFFPPEVLRALVDYSWPGNVRELQSLVERCVYICEGETVQLDDLPEPMRQQIRPANRYALPDDKNLEEVELDYIRHILDRCEGNRVRAAEILGINRKTIQRKLND